jgi:glycosyltransferase involved in cell wall biosynthesis
LAVAGRGDQAETEIHPDPIFQMTIRTVLVCEAQVPFVEGGAELHVRSLVSELRARGYDAELVSIPFKWYPKEEILAHAAAWRLIDLSESNGRPIDCVIATKFPTYFVRHPHKVTWLIHQYRAAYELAGTPYSDFDHIEGDVALRRTLLELDTRMLGESRQVFANARNTASRVERFNGIAAKPLYHPPHLASRLHAGEYGPYVLSVGRLETVKRAQLAIEAMASVDPGVSLVLVGDGTQRANTEAAVERLGLRDRVRFAGSVPTDTLIDLYAGALAVVYAPYDEDFGYVTLEAFLSRKPVITARDSGGPLEFVDDGVNGTICEPDAGAIAAAINAYAADRRRAASHGDAGHARASAVTWDGVIEALLQNEPAVAPPGR